VLQSVAMAGDGWVWSYSCWSSLPMALLVLAKRGLHGAWAAECVHIISVKYGRKGNNSVLLNNGVCNSAS
jgi:hypothetical protein